jgi:hypothetical protein
MKVNAEAFEREFRKGLRILIILLAVVGCALAWAIFRHLRESTTPSAEELRGFAFFFLCAAVVYGIGLITRWIVRKLAVHP